MTTTAPPARDDLDMLEELLEEGGDVQRELPVDVDVLRGLIAQARRVAVLERLGVKLVRKVPIETHLLLTGDEALEYDLIYRTAAEQPAPTGVQA